MTEIIPQDIVNPLPTLKASHVFVRVFTRIRLVPLGLAIIFGLVQIWVVSLILLLVAIGLAIKATRKSLDEQLTRISREANTINREIDSHNRSIAKISAELDGINLKTWDYFNDLSIKLEEIEQYYEKLKHRLKNKNEIGFWNLMDDAYLKFEEFSNTIRKIEECQEKFQLVIDDYHQNVTKINQYDKGLSIRINSYQPRVIPDPENFILDDQEFPDATTPDGDFQKIHDEAIIIAEFKDEYRHWESEKNKDRRHKESEDRKDERARQEAGELKKHRSIIERETKKQTLADERKADAAVREAEAQERGADALDRGADALDRDADATERSTRIHEEDYKQRWGKKPPK